MPRLVAPLVAAALLLAAPVASAQQHGGYAGQQSRETKALSAQETADLLAGRGMGLARAAELNGYPGPMHMLKLRGPLDLSVAQLTAARRASSACRPPLGHWAPTDRTRTHARWWVQGGHGHAGARGSRHGGDRQVARQAARRHLAAHLEMRDLLTLDQVARYDELRGYAGDGAVPSPAAPGGAGAHRH